MSAHLSFRAREDEGGGAFEMIAGHRRLAAWIHARGAEPIPAIVLAADDHAAEDLLVAENLVRRDLTPMEEALTVAQLRAHGRTMEQTAAVVRKSERWVYRRAAIADVGEPWRSHLAKSRASYPRCLAIARLPESMRGEAWTSFCSVLHDGRRDEAWWSDAAAGLPALVARLRFLDARCPFDCRKACRNCPHRSDRQTGLWDEDETRLPRCLDPACYERHAREAAERAAAAKAAPAPQEAPAAQEAPASSSAPPRERQPDTDARPATPPNPVSQQPRGGAEALSEGDLGVRMGVVWTVSQLLHGDRLEDVLPRIADLRAETVRRGGWLAHVRENALPRLSRNQEEARASLATVRGMW